MPTIDVNLSNISGERLVKSFAQTAHGLSVGDVVRWDATTNTHVKAQADSASNAEVAGVVYSVADVDNFTIIYVGLMTDPYGGTDGNVLFLSPTTAGATTETEPSTTGQVSKPIGQVRDTNFFVYHYRGLEIADATGNGVPDGGIEGQILIKNSATDGDATWQDIPADTTYIIDLDFPDAAEVFTFKAPIDLQFDTKTEEPGTTATITGYTLGTTLSQYQTFTISVDVAGMVTLTGVTL